MKVAFGIIVAVGAALGISLTGIVGIEHPLTGLLVHHLSLLQQPCQVVYRHRELLGNLGGREAAHALQHLVAVLSLGLQFPDVTCQILDLFLLRHIGTRLADLGQHLRGHPALERLRLAASKREPMHRDRSR